MSVGTVVLGLLGLAPQFAAAESVISGTEAAVGVLMHLKELAESDAFAKFKEQAAADIGPLLAGSKTNPDGSVHLDVKPVESAASQPMVWAWADSFSGWSLVTRANAVANGWPIYGE